MEPPLESPSANAAGESRPVVAATARRVVFGFGVREIGFAVTGMAVLIAAGVWFRGRNARSDADRAAVRMELAIRADAAEVYRDKIAQLKNEASQVRTWAEAQTNEPLRTWARERAKRMDAFVAALDHDREASEVAAGRAKVERALQDGAVDEAKARLSALATPQFPAPAEFSRLRAQIYDAPLAEFSRQNPDYYRAFRQFDADAAKRDETALRAEIASAGAESVTPQLMVKVELLASVAAADDPIVGEWSALAAAIDYFESPDGPTLAHWRKAQQALRRNDPGAAATEMQAIVVTKVRTRQPFRAAYGRVLIKARPDQPGQAYPYLAEAAAAGDKQARLWVAREDQRQQRYAQAQRWAEAAVADGDAEAVPIVLDLYQKHANAIDADAAHQALVLQRVVDRADSPADAAWLLGKLYERGDPPGSTPGKAFACYARAAAKGSAAGSLEVARCAARGIGTPENPAQAVDAAIAAFRGGERNASAALLLEMMRRTPDRVAPAVQQLFEHDQVGEGGGYAEQRIVDGPGVEALKSAAARYLDGVGQFAGAARLYASSRDPGATRRRAELTAAHPCETCGGLGKVTVSAACPTCGGKGRQICSFCGGTGIIFVPGTPPCSSCGGSGTMVQDRKVVACSTCGGTGKGKGSVIKQDCTHCEHGYIRCPECTGGIVKIAKECPDCHGRGTWTLIEKSE